MTGTPHPDDPAVKRAANDTLWMGVLPVYLAANSHAYMVSRLPEVLGTGQPYCMHATWTYGGAAGKVSRLREALLWHDPPEYYTEGSYVTVDVTVPEMPEDYNTWEENEPQIQFHLGALRAQLEQAAVGMAFAVATGRTFIMPKVW